MDRCYCVQFCTIVESGVKHHNSSPLTPFMDRCYCVQFCTIQSDRINCSSDLIKTNEIILTDDHFPRNVYSYQYFHYFLINPIKSEFLLNSFYVFFILLCTNIYQRLTIGSHEITSHLQSEVLHSFITLMGFSRKDFVYLSQIGRL